MNSTRKLLMAACAGLTLATASVALAPAYAEENRVYAIVDGKEITGTDLERAGESFAQALRQVPLDQRQQIVLNALIEAELLSKAAEAEGMQDTPEFQQQMVWLRQQALRDAYVKTKIGNAITDTETKARYDQLIASQPDQQEIHARHILVKTEDEAKAIIEALQGGADFVELAKTKSTGPSGPNGGDLGFFAKGRMVPEFEAAAFSLKPGEHSSSPVKSQFGWHVIKVEEQRTKPKPPYEAVKAQVREAMMTERLQEVLQDLRSKATIEIK